VEIPTGLLSGSLFTNMFTMDYSDYRGGLNVKYPPKNSNIVSFGVGNFLVYPIPFSLTKALGAQLKFINVVPGSVIQIKSLSGRLVRSIQTMAMFASWDGKNDTGQRVAPGVFFYIATEAGSGSSKQGTILVVP